MVSRLDSFFLGERLSARKREVLFEVGLVPGHRDELDEAVGGIVVEPLGVGERDDAVVVGREGGVAGWGRSPRCRCGRR